MRTPRCKSCRYWERSYNFRAEDRDWGLCHFWGKQSGYHAAGVFMDFWDGHEPRGSDTCGWHNADPVVRDQARSSPTAERPAWKTEGEPAR